MEIREEEATKINKFEAMRAIWRTVCMPKAKCAFRRSNPFELKLFEAQDQCDIRAHTKFQLPKC